MPEGCLAPFDYGEHMGETLQTDRYVGLLTECQNKLYAYIYSLTGSAEQAREILQETNHRLWEIRDQYDPSREFMPWAFKVSFNEVRSARKNVQRERLVFYDEETLSVIADMQVEWQVRFDDRMLALETCCGRLSGKQRELVQKYYKDNESVESIAEAMSRSANSVAVTLHRIRQFLADCMRRAIK